MPARGAGQVVRQPGSAFASPADLARRHAKHECVGGDVRSHDGAGANHCPLPYLMPAHDCGICPDGGTGAHKCPEVVGRALGVLGTRGEIVCEDAGRPAEHPVAKLHALIDGNVVLNLHAIADGDIVRNVHVLSKAAALTNPRTRLDVAEMPHLGAIADGGPLVNDRRRVHECSH